MDWGVQRGVQEVLHKSARKGCGASQEGCAQELPQVKGR